MSDERPITGIEAYKDQSPEDLDLAIQALEMQIAQEESQNPVSTFVPNGAIEKFIRAVGLHDTRDERGELTKDGKKWIFVLPAANAVGKTSSTIAILANIIWGPQNKWFDYPTFRNWPHPSKEIWYMSEQTTLKEVVCGTDEGQTKEIHKWFPKGRFKFSKFGMDFLSSLTTDNGWNIVFKTYDMEPRKFESATISVAVFDEPPPKQIYDAVVARLRTGGIIIMPMTPLTHAAWVKDELVDRAHDDSEIFVLYADVEQTCIEHGIRGRIPHKLIERLISQYSPEEREARAEGKFGHMQGVILKGLHPAQHRHKYDPEDFTQHHSEKMGTMFKIFNVVDPHELRLPAIIWGAVDEWGKLYIIDEFPSVAEYGLYHKIIGAKWTVTDICEAIRDKEVLNGWNPREIVRIMDPRGAKKKMGETGDTLQQYMAKVGKRLNYPLRYNTNVNTDIMVGLALIRDIIQPVLLDHDENGNPIYDIRFKVAIGHCENTWYHLTHFAQKRREGKALEQRGHGDAVEERFKDFVDAVRYLLAFIKKPRRTGEQEQRQLPEHYGLYGATAGESEIIPWQDPHRV